MKKKLLKATFFQCIYVVNYIYCFSPINQKKSLVIALLNVGKKNQVSYLCRKREMTKSERRNKKPEKYHIIHSSVRFLTRDFQQLSCFLKKFCQHPRLSDFFLKNRNFGWWQREFFGSGCAILKTTKNIRKMGGWRKKLLHLKKIGKNRFWQMCAFFCYCFTK